jgi:hypothetical protein
MKRALVGLAFVLVGLFLPQIQERIPDILVKPEKPAVIQIAEPNQQVIEKVSSVAKLVTDDMDRVRLAIFNDIFANRVLDYDADSQQINDVYTEAARNIFGSSMRGKYEGYAAGITGLFIDVLGTQNHQLSEIEKGQLSAYFRGLAWCLVNQEK